MKTLSAAVVAATLAMGSTAYAGCETQETGIVDMTGVYVCHGCQVLAQLQDEIRIVQNGTTLLAQNTKDVTVHSMTVSALKVTWGSVKGTIKNNCQSIIFDNGTTWLRVK